MIVLLKASIVIVILLAFYKLVLERESFYAANRMYLLGSLILAIALPFLTLPKLINNQGFLESMMIKKEMNVVTDNPTKEPSTPNIKPSEAKPLTGEEIYSLEPISTKEKGERLMVEGASSTAEKVEPSLGKTKTWIFYIYLFGVAVLLINLIAQIINLLYKVYRTDDKIISDEGVIVNLTGETEPCSFFKYIFINPASYDFDTYEQILAHEKIHIRCRHSMDLLLSEIAVIFLWFNPFIWLMRKEVEKNLEYQTDDILVGQNKEQKQNYQLNLVKIACYTRPLAVTTNYNQSQIKQRILKMNGKRSNKFNYWKYAFVLPLLFLLALGLNSPLEAEPNTKNGLDFISSQESLSINSDSSNDPVEDGLVSESMKTDASDNYLANKSMSDLIANCKEFEEAVARGDLNKVKEILKTLDPDCLKLKKDEGNNLSSLKKLVDSKKEEMASKAVVDTDENSKSTCALIEKAVEDRNYRELRSLLASEDISCLNDIYGEPTQDVALIQGLLNYGARMNIDQNNVIHISDIGFIIDVIDYEKEDCRDENYLDLAEAIIAKNRLEVRRILAMEDLSCPLNANGVTNDFPFIKELMKYDPLIRYDNETTITIYGVGVDIDLDRFEEKSNTYDGELKEKNYLSEEERRALREIENLLRDGSVNVKEDNCLDLIAAIEVGAHGLAKKMLKNLGPNCYHRITETISSPEGSKWSNSHVITPLIAAARQGDRTMADILITSFNADVNYSGDGKITPLMHAVESGNIELVKLLLERGANPRSKDEDGKTALDRAEKSGNDKIANYLKSILAD